MTNKQFYVIINQLTHCVKKKKKNKVKMEVYAEITYDIVSPHSKSYRTCTKNTGMEKMSVNLEQSANYLIQLFYRTGKIYSCTRTKIGKLLSIVAFSYARKNILCFNEKIFKYDECGTIINELEAHVDREVYLKCEYDNSKKTHTKCIDQSLPILDLAQKYQNIDCLADDVKIRIEEVFCKFAAYSPTELGQCICPVVNCPGITMENGEINLEQIFLLQKNNIDSGDYPRDLIEYLV